MVLVRIENVMDTPESTQEADGVPHKRRVTFSNEVSRHGLNNLGGGDEPTKGTGEEVSLNRQVDSARRAEYQPTLIKKFMALAKWFLLTALTVFFLIIIMVFWESSMKPQAVNIFIDGTELDMYVYISEDSEGISNSANAKLVWEQRGLIYGDWYRGPNFDGTFVHSTEVHVSKHVQNNGSRYVHTYIIPKESFLERLLFSTSPTLHRSKMLTKFKQKKYSQSHNLLKGKTEASAEEKAKLMSSEIVSHWHPNLTISIVADWTHWTIGAAPDSLKEYIKFIPNELKYEPILFYNDFWNLEKEYYPVNDTTPVLPLTLTFQPLSLFKFKLYAELYMRSASTSLEAEEHFDDLKETLLDTNLYLLGFLASVAYILDSIFELLAFKNDIQFWKDRRTLEGLSVRSVFFNVFQSLIVLLYDLNNKPNFKFNFAFIGLSIEIWKISKVMDVKIDRENLVIGIFPRIKFSDKGSYVESSTKQYDMLAFQYLSWVMFPLLFCYAIYSYSLVYVEQKGWYSWVLRTLYGFLFNFGFIMMTPQLFINYKLKSVAHLPWQMLKYTFLRFFVDDIFALVFKKMPTINRIRCLRDDVIFFIYMFQWYIYPIDTTRNNEFGSSAEMLEEKQKGKVQPSTSDDGSDKTERNESLTQRASSSTIIENNGGRDDGWWGQVDGTAMRMEIRNVLDRVNTMDKRLDDVEIQLKQLRKRP